jgi:LPS-assembly protein
LPQGRLRGWIIAVMLLWVPSALAQQLQLTAGKGPVLITADQVTYDRDLGVVVASGHVEVSQNDRVLLANTLTYNERTKTVSASGDVSLVDKSGNVVFADYMEVTDDLKNGVIKNIKMLMTDKSRVAAVQGSRKGQFDEFNKGVYSPCKPCMDKAKSMAPPIWQLQARKIVHDNDAHDIVYTDAWMEIFGVPVIFTPYFSTPDPTVKRRSGFLAPQFAQSSNYGFQYQQPYFWAISGDKDLTIAPMINTNAPPVLTGEYRQRLVDGKITVDFAGTDIDLANYDNTGVTTDEGQEPQGYVDGNGRFDLSKNWRGGFDLLRTTDPAFLRLFNISNQAYATTLNSEVFGEGFDGRSYASIQGWSFQTMTEGGNNNILPIITPVVNYNLVGDSGKYGAYWSANFDMMNLSRISGTDSRRVLGSVSWTLPYTAPAGDIYKLTLSMRADGYWVQNANTTDNTDPTPALGDGTFTGLTGRLFPQLAFDWRYPFERRTGHTTQVFEPIFSAIASPNGGNPNTIPNEDSQDFQLDETNMFDASRVTGYDLVDSGQRINYGARYSIYGDDGGSTSFFLGQSYQLGPESAYDEGAGIGSDFSDVVGAVQVSPTSAFDVTYRFRVDASNGSFKRQEISSKIGTPRFNASISYIFLNGLNPSVSATPTASEIYGTVASQVDDNWSLFFSGRRDLETNQTLEYGAGITYRNDCIAVTLTGSRSNYENTGVEPSTTVMLTLGFKNLGNFGANF